MLRRTAVALAGAIIAVALSPDTRPVQANPPGKEARPASLRGVWKTTEVSIRRPDGTWMSATPQVSLYIFTERHYSYMFTTGAGPRRRFEGDPNKPTETAKAAAYDTFVAASGTYSLSGRALTLHAMVHKNPNEMAGEALTYTADIEADTVRMTIVDPPFAPGSQRRITLARVE